MSKYDEDLKKSCEILNNTELDELVKVAVEAMDDAATDIGMEENQEWHAKITLESALIHIAEKVAKRPLLTIPKSIADILDNVFNSFTELQNNANSLMIQTIYTHYEPETTFYKWFNKEDNSYNISIIYLAGKALGVDLVKVVEG